MSMVIILVRLLTCEARWGKRSWVIPETEKTKKKRTKDIYTCPVQRQAWLEQVPNARHRHAELWEDALEASGENSKWDWKAGLKSLNLNSKVPSIGVSVEPHHLTLIQFINPEWRASAPSANWSLSCPELLLSPKREGFGRNSPVRKKVRKCDYKDRSTKHRSSNTQKTATKPSLTPVKVQEQPTLYLPCKM